MNPSQLGRIRTRHRWRACCRSGRCELRALQQVASVPLSDLARDHAGGHGLCLAREVATLLQSARPTHSLRHATASTAPPLACADERPRHRSTGPDAGVQPPATRVELEREHAERHAACELAYPHPAVGAYPCRRDCCGLADRVRSERAAQRLARCFPSHVRASIAHAASDATRSCEAPRDGRERACALRRACALQRAGRIVLRGGAHRCIGALATPRRYSVVAQVRGEIGSPRVRRRRWVGFGRCGAVPRVHRLR